MITVKQGDTHTIAWTVQDGSGIPVDLTGATVRVLCRRDSSTPAEVLESTVTDAAAGVISHALTGDLTAWLYRVEIECTQDGVITTAPTDGYDQLKVVADLD